MLVCPSLDWLLIPVNAVKVWKWHSGCYWICCHYSGWKCVQKLKLANGMPVHLEGGSSAVK